MKKILIGAAMLVANITFAGQINNFQDLSNVMAIGTPVHIVVDVDACAGSAAAAEKAAFKATSTGITGVFTPTIYQLSAKKIVTSVAHLTLSNPAAPQQAVYEYIKYTILANNAFTMSYVPLDAVTYKKLGATHELNCSINDGVKLYS